LAVLDWGGERITVTEAKSISFSYEFSGFNNAFAFLDALLMHRSVKAAETSVESAALASLAALSPAEKCSLLGNLSQRNALCPNVW